MAAHPPKGIDVTRPSQARIYNYLLGGHDYYAIDVDVAERYLRRYPHARTIARANRAFVGRAVRYLAGHGVRQFLDLGSGLPTAENVHQVAQRHAPESRVVYVDNDPSVLAHGRALLADGDATYVQADIRDTGRVLSLALELLDFDEPVGLLCTSVLHYVPDEDDPAGLMRRYTSALAPGSHLVLSHMTLDGADPDAVAAAAETWRGDQWARPRTEIEAMVDGLDPAPPGLVDVELWRPDEPAEPGALRILGGVARKP